MFPYYMSLGMSWNEYWNDSPRLVVYYRKAHDLYIEQKNQEMYMQGLYNFHAFSAALANFHLDGKSHKPVKYLNKPFEVLPKTEEQKIDEAKRERKKIINSLIEWKKAWDAKKKG